VQTVNKDLFNADRTTGVFQKYFGKPACLSTPLALWRDTILLSTGNRRSDIGLNHMA